LSQEIIQMSQQQGAMRNNSQGRPANMQSLPNSNQHSLNDALLHVLDSDLSRYKAMYQGFKELELQLRQVYQHQSPEHLPAAPRRSDDSWAGNGDEVGRLEAFACWYVRQYVTHLRPLCAPPPGWQCSMMIFTSLLVFLRELRRTRSTCAQALRPAVGWGLEQLWTCVVTARLSCNA
jgi:hypothetical protein